MKLFNLAATVSVFFITASLSTTSFADQTDCEKMSEYFSKSNAEVSKAFAKKPKPEQRDDLENAAKCVETPPDAAITVRGKSFSVDDVESTANKIIAAAADVKAENLTDQLSKFNFAAGIGMHFLTGSDVITSVIDNGTFRTTSEEKYKLGLWLSSNTFFGTFVPGLFDNTRWGMFLATQLGGTNNQFLNSGAVGFSIASTQKPSSVAGSAPLVFQFGYGFTHIQTYANGYADGMTVSAGVNQPLMQHTIGKGWVVIVSTALF